MNEHEFKSVKIFKIVKLLIQKLEVWELYSTPAPLKICFWGSDIYQNSLFICMANQQAWNWQGSVCITGVFDVLKWNHVKCRYRSQVSVSFICSLFQKNFTFPLMLCSILFSCFFYLWIHSLMTVPVCTVVFSCVLVICRWKLQHPVIHIHVVMIVI